jgi:WD40 repeat protein
MLILQGEGELVESLEFSPDGRGLASVLERSVQFWADVTAGKPREVLPKRGYWQSVRFMPDGRALLLEGYPVGVLDLATKQVTPIALELERGASFDLSPDGRYVVFEQSNSGDGASGLLCLRPVSNLSRSEWSATVATPGHLAARPLFLPGDRILALSRRDKRTTSVVFDARTGAELSRTTHKRARLFNSLAQTADRRLIAGRQAARISVFPAGDLAAAPLMIRNDNSKEFTDLAFHPSGRFLAATSNDATVKLYDTSSWKLAHAFDWEIGRLRSIAFSPDGMLAAAGGDKGQIVVWDFDL